MNIFSRKTFGLRQFMLALIVLAIATPAVPALATTLNWTWGERIQGNGSIKKQARALEHFSGVSLNLPASLELRIGNTESVTIETDDNLLPLIETVIEDGTLKIRTAKKNTNIETHTMKIVVQAKDVNRIALGGSGSIASDALRAPKLQFDLGGSGSINVKGVEADVVAVSVGGSGKMAAGGGSTSKLSVSIGGSGDVQFGPVKANNVSVSIGGSGDATVWARDSLSVTIAGSGDVTYYGDPKISKTVAGSGGTRRLAAAPR
jgi:hypothetical protein